MTAFTVGQLLRIFVGEGAMWHNRPLDAAIVEFLRHEGVAGASVFRGFEGFGSHHEFHVATMFGSSRDLPILIEVVDTEEKIASIIPRIDEMVSEGAMTLERVEFRRFQARQEAKAKDGFEPEARFSRWSTELILDSTTQSPRRRPRNTGRRI
jgi:PII-like signaling protein